MQVHTVVQKLFNRKYFIDNKVEGTVKHFREYMTFLKFFTLNM